MTHDCVRVSSIMKTGCVGTYGIRRSLRYLGLFAAGVMDFARSVSTHQSHFTKSSSYTGPEHRHLTFDTK